MFCISTTTTVASAGGDIFSWDDVGLGFPSVVDDLCVLGVLDVLNVSSVLGSILCVAGSTTGHWAGHW